ncbi:MAG: photosystem I reaction center subunit VIII [Hormoscilla sp. GUM202]|jgi:photosystem I reaction center subunit VIII|nr:photosystem I reaction center subunit VIII [Hormoscilla sp. GUM202]
MATTASYLPWIFVPLVGMVLPTVAMGLFFIYVESEE